MNTKKEISKKELIDGNIIEGLGKSITAWKELVIYILGNYDVNPVLFANDIKGVNVIRFRKSGKTLITLEPKNNIFIVLLVLGKKEVENTNSIFPRLSNEMKVLITKTEQLHDGKWLFMDISKKSQLNDIKLLLGVKKKPKKII